VNGRRLRLSASRLHPRSFVLLAAGSVPGWEPRLKPWTASGGVARFTTQLDLGPLLAEAE